MANKLGVYNKALVHIEERTLASLAEQREPRRVFDALWDDVVAYCLSQGLFRFAKRVVLIEASDSIVPSFGYTCAFTIPDDWVRTVVISAAPQLDPPLLQYSEETGYWFANATPLYVSYISNDAKVGLDLSNWPATFTEYVAYRLAAQSARRLTGKKDLADDLDAKEIKAKRNTKGIDAMNDPPGLPPVPYLVRSRRGVFGPGGLRFGSGEG